MQIAVIILISVTNLRALNLNLLLVLDALLTERHVTRAARRLGLTQPAVSNALAQLRTALGDPLLVRGPGGMVPTPRAQALTGPLRAALAALEETLAPEAPFDPARAERTFVLATTDFVSYVLLPRLLQRLAAEAPGIRLQVRAWSHHRVPPTLETGEVDLMLGFYPRLPPGHHEQRVFRDQFVCVVRRDHPTVRDKLTLRQYVGLSHVLVSEEGSGPGVVDVALAAKGLQRRVGLRLSHFLLVPPVLAATDMVAALSERVAEPFARHLPLRLLPPPLPLPTDWIRQVWHERTNASPPHVWLRSVIAGLEV